MTIEKLISQVKLATSKEEKQKLSAHIVSLLPEFLKELGDLEQKYQSSLRNCIRSEGTKSGGELVMSDTDLHKEYKLKKRIHETVEISLKVLDMYV